MIRDTEVTIGGIYRFPGGLRQVVAREVMINRWGDRFYGVRWVAVGPQALGIMSGTSWLNAFCKNGRMLHEREVVCA